MAMIAISVDDTEGLLEEAVELLANGSPQADRGKQDSGLLSLAFASSLIVNEQELPPTRQNRYLLNLALAAGAVVEMGGELTDVARSTQRAALLKLRALGV